MAKKQNQVYVTVAIIIVILGGIWFFKNKDEYTPSKANNSAETSTDKEQNPMDSGTTWTGTLKKSDNASKGNLMLVTKDRTIYMQTSRDFSPLLDKEVSVSYEGDYTSFILGDIKAK